MEKLIIDKNYAGLQSAGTHYVLDGEIVYNGNIKITISLSVTGAIYAGGRIDSDGSLKSCTRICAKEGRIYALQRIWSGGDIIAGGPIWSAGDIIARGSIICGDELYSLNSIWSGCDINAGGKIIYSRSIYADGKIMEEGKIFQRK